MLKNFKNIIITGGAGMVGSYFDFGQKLDKGNFDITDGDACLRFFKDKKPDLVIHLAALTDMAYCEENPEEAYKVNSLGTYNIARSARSVGAKMVYLSSGTVFGKEGKSEYGEKDLPGSLNVYGRTKLAGEYMVSDIDKNNLVIRTGWLFGGGEKNDKKFVSKIIIRIKEGKKIKAISDRFGSPAYIKDVVLKISELIEQNASGTYHAVNSGKASYYDFALVIAKYFDYDKISPCPASDFKEIAPRPESEVLVSEKIILRPWQDALNEYLETEWK
ncbi:MAG: NAD(P)-dependent oxidoreductase [Candidatus Wolfebacteria bacterium]|nr:NAD(P)-dependent oxidoreductase [Candidatus Wolfebacteria bacterium]